MFILCLVSSRMSFVFVTVTPRHLNFSRLLKVGISHTDCSFLEASSCSGKVEHAYEGGEFVHDSVKWPLLVINTSSDFILFAYCVYITSRVKDSGSQLPYSHT